MAQRIKLRNGAITNRVKRPPEKESRRTHRTSATAFLMLLATAVTLLLTVAPGSLTSSPRVGRFPSSRLASLSSGTGKSSSASRESSNDAGRNSHRSTKSSDPMYNGVDQTELAQCIASGGNCLETVSGLAACMASGEDCNQNSPLGGETATLDQTDPDGTPLLTEAAAESEDGATITDPVLAETMPYSEVGSINSELDDYLANQSRTAWVITVESGQPITSSWGAPGVTSPPASSTVYTVVIDAATGVETGYCIGCSPLGMPTT